VTAFGETMRLHEWVKDPRCMTNYQTLYFRVVRAGWRPETAISTPRHGLSKPVIVTDVAT
jgi:hypothetical protein